MIGLVLHCTSVESFAQQWEYAICHFSPDTLYCVGGEGADMGRTFARAECIADSGDLPDVPLILLSPANALMIPGTESIEGFTHPADAIYWLGSNSRHLNSDLFARRAPDASVFIPTDSNDQMYSWTAYAVAMWDRRMKG